MKLLNVEIQTDRTGEVAALIPHARVVLERANSGAEWKAKSYFPTADPPGWQCAKDVPLTGKSVRGPGNGLPVVAPDYAR